MTTYLMEDLSLNNINPNADASIPADSKGLIRKFQKNVELSYQKWKKRYKEIEAARRYSLGRLNEHTKGMNIDQAINSFKPPIFWKDKDLIKQQIKMWDLNDIETFIIDLNNTESLVKKNPQVSNQIMNNMILIKTVLWICWILVHWVGQNRKM